MLFLKCLTFRMSKFWYKAFHSKLAFLAWYVWRIWQKGRPHSRRIDWLFNRHSNRLNRIQQIVIRNIFGKSKASFEFRECDPHLASFVSPQSMFNVISQKRLIIRNLNVFWNDRKRSSSIDCQSDVNQSPRAVQGKAVRKDSSHIRTLITIAKILFALAWHAARSKQSLFDRGCIQIASLLALEYFYPGYIHTDIYIYIYIYIARSKGFSPSPGLQRHGLISVFMNCPGYQVRWYVTYERFFFFCNWRT